MSGVINDPTDPAKNFGLDFTISDANTPLANLTVAVSSSKTTVVPTANVVMTGSGAQRHITITPTGVGYSTITLSVGDGTSTTLFRIAYAASAASSTPNNTTFHTGISDASDAFALDNDYYISGDDELDVLNVYSRTQSGLPVTAFDYTNELGLDPEKPEVDLEAGAVSPTTNGRIYWIGSMSNSKAPFENRPNRDRLFATDITGTGTSTLFDIPGTPGYFGNMKAALVAWGDLHGYNFTASAVAGKDSKLIDGFAAEGLVFGPDNTSLWIGLRAPLVPTTNRTKAVIAPISNFENWFNNGAPSGSPTFAAPIELDLGGRGFRDMIRLSNGTYIIVAGNPAGSPLTSAIFKWTGIAADAPILVSTPANGNLNLEGVMPVVENGKLSLNKLQLVTDGGDEALYGTTAVAKDQSDLHLRKFRSDRVENIDLCMTTYSELKDTACGSYTLYGNTFTSTGDYTITTTTDEGCDKVITLKLYIKTVPVVAANANTTTLCVGDDLVLSGSGASSYTWNNGVVNAVSFNPTQTSTYTVTGTAANGCSDTDAIKVVVNTLPTVKANATFNAVCKGEKVLLFGTGTNQYTWSSNVIDRESFIPTGTKTYTVKGTNATGCSNFDTITVIVHELPVVTLNLDSDTVCTSDAAFDLSGGSPSGGEYSGVVSNGKFDPAQAGPGIKPIIYNYIGLYGCSGSASSQIVVDVCAGIGELSAIQFDAYPNPVKDLLTITADVAIYEVQILNVNGALVYNQHFIQTNNTINLSSFAKGVYFLQVKTEAGVSVRKLVKE